MTVIQNNELTISSLDFLNDYINPARLMAGERPLRNAEMVRKLIDELDLNKSDFLFYSNGGRGRPAEYIDMDYDQMFLIGMRESKSVRKSVLAQLKKLKPSEVTPQHPQLPQSFAEALMLAANQAMQIEQQQQQIAIAAPKVDFAERIAKIDQGVKLGEYAKTVNLGPKKIFALLRDMKILIRGCQGYNLPMQQYIDAGYFVVRQTTYGPEDDKRIANTPLITGKGELWLTNKLVKSGVLKAVAA
ncbi:phage antirepressor KilAC domain-containing protein [Photobacterium leiognathi subsp. mandapamensis]